MEQFQRRLLRKINNGTLTQEEYKKVNKKLYSILTRIELCRKYNPVFYYGIYILAISFISTIISLLVSLAVK